MIDTFYMMNCGTEESPRWLLRVRDIHITMSAVSSREKVEECLDTIVKRYKNKKTLMTAINRMDNPSRFSSKEYLKKCQNEYLTLGQVNDEDVRVIVARALKEVIKESPVYKNKERVKVLSSPNLVLGEVEVTKVEEKPKTKLTPVKTLKGLNKLTKISKVALPSEEEEDEE